MKFIVAAIILFVACANAYTEEQYQGTFTSWMQKFQKSYTQEVFNIRYTIFKSHMDFVRDWNADPSHTHTVELNKFADVSTEEYQSIYLGTRVTLPNYKPRVPSPMISLPQGDVINWAAKGAVTPPKDQGQCGSCWSFSTTGSVEGLNFIYTGNLISVSEQNLMDCSSAYGNGGCNGGLMDNAFKYIKANGGIDTEASYPYQAVVGSCRYNPNTVGATIGGYVDVASGDEGALANAVNGRPVSIAIDAGHTSFQLYQSGVYYEPACSSSNLDHGVLAIGYGDDNGNAYWIVKNSWGLNWGLQGYIWMSRNRGNNCGVASMASYPTNA